MLTSPGFFFFFIKEASMLRDAMGIVSVTVDTKLRSVIQIKRSSCRRLYKLTYNKQTGHV